MGTAVQISTARQNRKVDSDSCHNAMKYEGSAPGLGVSALSAGYAHHKVIEEQGIRIGLKM